MATIIVRQGDSELGRYTLFVGPVVMNGMEVWKAESFEGFNMADPILSVTAMSEHGARNALQIAMLSLIKRKRDQQQAQVAGSIDYKDMK